MAEPDIVNEGGGGSGALTALAVILFIIVLLAVLYFTGVFGRMFGTHKTQVDVNINKPGVVLRLN
jgi:ABC-type transporter Mla subunit MlaD